MAAKKTKYARINRSLYFPFHICFNDGLDRQATIQLPIMSFDSKNDAANFVAQCLVIQGEDGGFGEVGINVGKTSKHRINVVTSGDTKTIVKQIVKCLNDLNVQASDGSGRRIPDLLFPYYKYEDAAKLAKQKGVTIDMIIDRCSELMYEYDPTMTFHSFSDVEEVFNNC